MRDEFGRHIQLEIRSAKDVAASCPGLQERGSWTCLNILPGIDWPVRPQSLLFCGCVVWIIPATLDRYPGVAMKRPLGMEPEEAEALLLRFLSAISWLEQAGTTVAYHSGGSFPHMMELDKQSGYAIKEGFDFTGLYCPEDEKIQIAFALMREGRALRHFGYAFLSFWRVLELAYPNSKERTTWMADALPALSEPRARDVVQGLVASGVADVGKHLFESGRCAIAHATSDPIINPDNPTDAKRLMRELPIVEALAVRAIEDRYHVYSPQTEWRQHLYELRGWKEALGSDLVGKIRSGGDFLEGGAVDLPRINVRLRTCPAYGPLEGMEPKRIEISDGRVELTYQSFDNRMALVFYLDIRDERLIFDIDNSLFGNDDGSVAFAEHKRDFSRFRRDYLLNGELQMWDADTGQLLSRLDAFMPVNCFVDLEACNSIIEAAAHEAEFRKRVSSEFAKLALPKISLQWTIG